MRLPSISGIGIAARLSLLILPLTLLISAWGFGYTYRFARRLILDDARAHARDLSAATAGRVEALLAPIEKVPESIVYFLEHAAYSEADIPRLLREVVRSHSEIYGCAIAFAPRRFRPKRPFYCPYAYHPAGFNGPIAVRDLGSSASRYVDQPWFSEPMAAQRASWSEPYLAQGGDRWMATYSLPFYRVTNGRREYIGVATADIDLESFRDLVSQLPMPPGGYALLVSRSGALIASGLPNAASDPRLQRQAKEIAQRSSTFHWAREGDGGASGWLASEPVPGVGWTMAEFFPEAAVTQPVGRLEQFLLGIAVLGGAAVLVLVVWGSRALTRPLTALAAAAKEIAGGNFDAPLPAVRSKDEVGRLSAAFRTMQAALKEYVVNLRETTAERERMESELAVAREIQMDILPKPLAGRPEVDLAARLEPAREVGGDLYDYGLLGDRLWMAVGDISGKGVPAALFMSVTATLLRVGPNEPPAAVLLRLNRELRRGNERSMFVTLFYGVLDLATGRFEYANAGHNRPFLVHRDGGVEMLPKLDGVVLGITEPARYRSGELTLAPGDALVIYTDGVTEAMDANRRLFSDDRLAGTLRRAAGASSGAMVDAIFEAVRRFAGEAEQHDDITVVALTYRGAVTYAGRERAAT